MRISSKPLDGKGTIDLSILSQIILAFWLVLTYDLLEDTGIDDVNLKNIFPLFFKMAKRFQNLGNILRRWAKNRVQKWLVEAVNRCEKQEEEGKSRVVFGNDSEKILE